MFTGTRSCQHKTIAAVADMRITMIGLLLELLLAVYQVDGGKISGFTQENVYVYDYEGRVATGLYDRNVKHFSGFGIKSLLKVYTKNDKVYFKFTDTKLGRVNTDVDDFFQPLHMNYTEPENEVLQKVVVEIQKPFVAVYDNGVFRSYDDPDDSHTNWRKAVVGIFQIQFNPPGQKHPHFFEAYEDGVGGECKTLYHITQISTEDTNVEEALNVTKLRLYDECKTRPHYFISSMYGNKCGDCNKDLSNALKTFGRVEYKVKGNMQQFTIEKVYATGTVTFTPFSTNGQTVISVVNQTLSLVSTTEESNPFDVDVKGYKNVTSLSFQFYPDTFKDVRDVKNLYYNRIFKQPVVEDPVANVLPRLKSIVACKAGCNEATILMRILYDLYTFEYKHYVELFENHVNFGQDATKEEKNIRSVLLEILPCIGTNAAVKYMFELIEQRKVDKNAAANMVSVFPHYTKELVHETIEIMEAYLAKTAVKDYLKSWNAGLLAYGTLVHKACVHDDLHPHITNEDVDTKRCAGYIKMLIDNFYNISSESPKDSLVYLKALLNTYHPDGYDVYKSVLQNEDFPTMLRQTAIWGVERFADTKHEEVAAIVAPIYSEPSNDYVLRINAFEVLLLNFGTPQFYSNLILSLEQEPNEQVASYIYSYLTTATNTADPCYKSLNEKARYVLQFVQPRQDSIFRHSSARIFSTYNELYNFGRKVQFRYIPSENSTIPREMHLTQSFNIMDYSFNFFEVGLIADEDSDGLLSSIANSFAPGVVRNANDIEEGGKIKDPMAKFHRVNTHPYDDARYQLYMKMFGHDLKFTHQYNPQDSNEVVIQGNKLTYDVHRISVFEIEYYVPNEMGFPVIFTLKVPTSIHLGGNGTLQFNPADGLAVNGDINAQLGVEFLVKARMFVYAPAVLKYGYELNTKGSFEFAIKGSLDINTDSNTFVLKYVPPTEPYDMFVSETTSLSIGPKERIPIKYSDNTYQKKYQFGEGLKYNFTWSDFSSFVEFEKSLFHSYVRLEDDHFIAKWLYRIITFIEYASINPTAKLYNFNVKFEPARKLQ